MDIIAILIASIVAAQASSETVWTWVRAWTSPVRGCDAPGQTAPFRLPHATFCRSQRFLAIRLGTNNMNAIPSLQLSIFSYNALSSGLSSSGWACLSIFVAIHHPNHHRTFLSHHPKAPIAQVCHHGYISRRCRKARWSHDGTCRDATAYHVAVVH